jgi:homopolymeric O-antigen transport system permease protein
MFLDVPDSFWSNRHLILRLARQQIAARYRGSVLGFGWSLVTPVLLLAVYTFVFGSILGIRWPVRVDNMGQYALILFAGLIVFHLFADCIARAPGVVAANRNYVKKVVFPLEALPWITLLEAVFQALMSLVVLFLAQIVLSGGPPWTAILLPVVLVPFLLVLIGISWLLASLGVFLRDIHHVIGLVTTFVLFTGAVFFPLEAVPPAFRPIVMLNPITFIIDQLRAVLLYGRLPDWLGLAAYAVLGWLVAWAGLWWFRKTRKAFADVL